VGRTASWKLGMERKTKDQFYIEVSAEALKGEA
jgi:hypothetical protein